MDVIGNFGLDKFREIKYRKVIGVVNALMCVIGVTFGIVGCLSYTRKFDAIVGSPWVIAEDTGTSSTYLAFGLRAFAEYAVIDGEITATDANSPIIDYNDCAGTGNDYCDECNKASKTVVALCSLALIGAFGAFCGNLCRTGCDSKLYKSITFFSSFISFILGCVSYVVFLKCNNSIRDQLIDVSKASDNNNYIANYGIGAKFVTVSFVFAFIISSMTLLVPVAEVAPKGGEHKPISSTELTQI